MNMISNIILFVILKKFLRAHYLKCSKDLKIMEHSQIKIINLD